MLEERIDRIEAGLRELGLEQCDKCGDWSHHLKRINTKVGERIVGYDACIHCEYDLKWDIV